VIGLRRSTPSRVVVAEDSDGSAEPFLASKSAASPLALKKSERVAVTVNRRLS